MDRLKTRRNRELERKKNCKSSPPETALKKNKRCKLRGNGSVLKPHSHSEVVTPARPSKTTEQGPLLVTPLPLAVEQTSTGASDDETTISETYINLDASALNSDANENSVQLSLSSDDESSAAMSSKSKSAKMTLKQAKERIQVLEFEIANYKNSLKTANEDGKVQEERINRLVTENESLRVAVEEIDAGDSLKDVLEKQSKELGNLEAKNASLRGNMEELQKKNTKHVGELESQIGDLKAKITQLLCQNKGNDRQESDTGLQKKIKALEQQLASLKAQNKTLASDLKNCSKDGNAELDKAQKQVASLTRELSAKNRDIKKLEQLLQERDQEIEGLPDEESFQKVLTKYRRYKEASQKLQAQLNAANGNGSNTDEGLALQMDVLVKEKKDLELANAQLRKALNAANDILKADGKFSKHEVRDGVKKKIDEYIKNNLYHKNKFCVGIDKQKEFCRDVYDGIKDEPELGLGDPNDKHYKPFDEFFRIYDATCRAALQNRRQYTQTKCFEAVIGTFCP